MQKPDSHSSFQLNQHIDHMCIVMGQSQMIHHLLDILKVKDRSIENILNHFGGLG